MVFNYQLEEYFSSFTAARLTHSEPPECRAVIEHRWQKVAYQQWNEVIMLVTYWFSLHYTGEASPASGDRMGGLVQPARS